MNSTRAEFGRRSSGAGGQRPGGIGPSGILHAIAAVVGNDAYLLEWQIQRAKSALITAVISAARLSSWLRMKELIGRRSPEQVKRMERERGLRDA